MNKILMIEQEKSTIQLARDRLSPSGIELLSALDGPCGFQMAKDKTPDLIITNALIPLMNGFELCKAIKHDEDTKSIPLVVMTEKHHMEESFMFLGVKDFLEKPVNMDELEKVVRSKLRLSTLMQQQRTKILINGKPEILTCCQGLLKNAPHWSGYFDQDSDSFLKDAIKYAPDVILIDIVTDQFQADEMIKELKSIPELKNSSILIYYNLDIENNDHVAIQAEMIGVQYMKDQALMAGAKEFLGPFNPVNFLKLIDIYRREFNFII